MVEFEQKSHLNKPEGGATEPGPEPVLPGQPKSSQVSELLKKAREEAGLSLRDVADALNIRYVYVEALETGDFDKLPGKTYAVGFLRTYSQYLDLDVAEILQRFKGEEAVSDPDTQLVFPTPVPEGKVPGGALIVVSVVFVAMAYGAWSFLSDDEMAVADLVPPVPEHLQTIFEGQSQDPQAETADEPAAGTRSVASVPNLTSPVFALPQPGGELEGAAAQPVETAAAMPAPESAAPTPEPVVADSVETALDARGTTGADPEAEVVPATVPDTPLQAPLAPEPSVPRAAVQNPVEPAPEADSQSTTVATAASQSSAAPVAEPVNEIPTPPAAAERIEAREQIAAIPTAPDLAAIPAAPSTDGDTPVFEDPTPRTYGAQNADARVVLHATQDAWVQVRDGEDSLLLTRLLRAGDSYRVPNRPDLKMLTGNAGGLEIEVDGKALGALGPVGKVRRDLSLAPDSLAKQFNLAQ